MSLPAARRHLGYSMVEILICRKAVAGGHEITSLDNKPRKKTVFFESLWHTKMKRERTRNPQISANNTSRNTFEIRFQEIKDGNKNTESPKEEAHETEE